jgi:hypothetical protein
MSILWLIPPSLVLFVALPFLLKKQVPFYPALLLACAATSLAYGIMIFTCKKLGFKI